MKTVCPRSPADLPLAQRDCEADGATYFSVDPVCRDLGHPQGGWVLCGEADAERFGLYRVQADGRSEWVSDHPTRAGAEAAAHLAEREDAV